MNERDMTLGLDWQDENPTGWLVSEKLDGCRAYWDGLSLWTRGGNTIPAPASLLSALPAGVHLDGELHCGRGGFEQARQATQLGRWLAACRFTVFDCPTAPGPWVSRLDAARAVWRDCVDFHPCANRRDLLAELRRVAQAGGEGLVIRHPTAIGYERGRTHNVLKVKP